MKTKKGKGNDGLPGKLELHAMLTELISSDLSTGFVEKLREFNRLLTKRCCGDSDKVCIRIIDSTEFLPLLYLPMPRRDKGEITRTHVLEVNTSLLVRDINNLRNPKPSKKKPRDKVKKDKEVKFKVNPIKLASRV